MSINKAGPNHINQRAPQHQRQVWGGVYEIMRRIDDEALAAHLKAAARK